MSELDGGDEVGAPGLRLVPENRRSAEVSVLTRSDLDSEL